MAAKKKYGGLNMQVQSFLASALDGVSNQLHVPSDLPMEKDCRVPIA
jgi:hypothetical protein